MPKISDSDLLYHTFTIDFPTRKAVGGSVELILYFSTAKEMSTGEIVFDSELHSPFNTLADYLEVKLMNCDEIVYDFDDREFLFALGQLEIKVFDKYENLKRILFNSKSADYDNDRCYLKFRPFDNSGEVIFEGYLDLESLHYDKKSKEITIQFFPNTGKLNDTPLYINDVLNDKFEGITEVGGVYLVTDLIKWIYKIANPNVTVDITNHWLYRGVGSASFYTPFGLLYGSIPAITDARSNSYAGVLKIIAASFGAITGMISSDRAIFKPYIGQAENVIDVTDRLVSYEQLYSRNELKFLSVNYRNFNPIIAGTMTSIESDGVTFNAEDEWYLFTDLANPGIDNRRRIYFIKKGDGYQEITAFQANYLSNYFLNIESAKKDKIAIKGYGVEIFNDIKVEGTYYRPLSVIKNTRKGTTEIEAVPIGFIFEDYDVSEPVALPPSGTILGNDVTGEPLNNFSEGGFTVNTAYQFVKGTTRLYRNGVRLKINDDYEEGEDSHSLSLFENILPDENIIIDYVKTNN